MYHLNQIIRNLHWKYCLLCELSVLVKLTNRRIKSSHFYGPFPAPFLFIFVFSTVACKQNVE